MRHCIRKVAWIVLVISAIAFAYQVITIAQLTSKFEAYRAEKAAINAEIERKNSWGNILTTSAKSFFDGLTLGMFTKEGMFEEYKQLKRWEDDVTRRDNLVCQMHNLTIARVRQKYVLRNISVGLSMVAAIILIFVKKSPSQTTPIEPQ